MDGNYIEQVGIYSRNYVDDVLIRDSVYNVLEVNKELDPDFQEVGWVKLLTPLVSGLSFYRVVNNGRMVVNAGTANYADYNGNVAADNRAGYSIGAISAKWTLYQIRFDRATQLKFDQKDLTTGGLERMLGGILRTFSKVAKRERDAVYSSILADCTNTGLGNRVIETDLTAENIYQRILAGKAWLYNHDAETEDMIAFVSIEVANMLSTSPLLTRFLNVEKINVGQTRDGKDVELTVRTLDGIPFIAVPEDRFFTDVALTENGYDLSATSRVINYIMVSKEFLYPITRLNTLRVYDDTVITSFDGMLANFHMWYDLIVPMMKRVALYCSVGNLKSAGSFNSVAISSTKGPNSGQTVVQAVYTKPAGMAFAKVYAKTTAFGDIGTTQAGGTLIEVGSPFTPAATSLYFAVVDFAGNILAKSAEALAVEVAD